MGDTPYNLRGCAYWQDFTKPKILYFEIVRSPQFYYDAHGEFCPEASAFMMVGAHLPYLCNILNSSVFTYFFKRFYAGGGLGEEGYRYKKVFFEQLPIPMVQQSPTFHAIEGANGHVSIEKECLALYDFSKQEKGFILSQCNR